jgi:hypothetical protein
MDGVEVWMVMREWLAINLDQSFSMQPAKLLLAAEIVSKALRSMMSTRGKLHSPIAPDFELGGLMRRQGTEVLQYIL